jgi:DNA-binding LacI/PurR family transcriptional regulator
MSLVPEHVKEPRRRVTMEDVAREARVSRSLVSLVMRDSPKVSDVRRARVLAAAERLGYRPNAMARGLASRRTRTLGVLLNELHNPFYAEIMDGIEEAADEVGYRLLASTGGRLPRGESRAIDMLLEHRVDGLVLVGPRVRTAEIGMAARQVPVVVVAREVRHPDVDWIANDELEGARLVIDHLTALGHRRITHVDGGRGAGAGARRRAYEHAMRTAGLATEIRVLAGEYSDAAGVRAAERLLESGALPTAIFAVDDILATGVIARLEEAGLTVPDDVSVVGYDNTFLAALHHVSLTTIDQPRPAMGREAVRALVNRVEHGSTRPLRARTTPSLVVRETTGPARASRSEPAGRPRTTPLSRQAERSGRAAVRATPPAP